jgi:hypothetical protein
MVPVRLSPEEAKRRNVESKERYRKAHQDEIREKRRLATTDEKRAKVRDNVREKIAKLVEAGVFEKLTPGRKRLYTPEEALEVAKRQRLESYHRRKERIEAAEALLVQAEAGEWNYFLWVGKESHGIPNHSTPAHSRGVPQDRGEICPRTASHGSAYQSAETQAL